jgi:hypothetical protein
VIWCLMIPPSLSSVSAASASFPGRYPEVPRLLNPHVAWALGPGAVEGQAVLVQGNYDYCHYLQDGEDDRGWGCAYRCASGA